MNDFPRPLLKAVGVQYCHLGSKTATNTIVERIIENLSAELMRVSSFTSAELNEWSISITGIPYSEYIDSYYAEDTDHDSISWYEDRTPTVYHEEFPAFDIHISATVANETVMECVICQENKDSSQFVKTQCGHSFCNSCTTSLLISKGLKRACCALCRSDFYCLVASNVTDFQKLSSQFSQTGALLRSCSLAVFGDAMWHCRTCKETIDMFLVEFAGHKDFVERVNGEAMDYDKAKLIWDFVRMK
jgi:hypothetical protein